MRNDCVDLWQDAVTALLVAPSAFAETADAKRKHRRVSCSAGCFIHVWHDACDALAAQSAILHLAYRQLRRDAGRSLLTCLGIAWLYKLESVLRSGQGRALGACTLGFEYTFAAVFASAIDLGLLAEYNYDGRDNSTLNVYDNDAFGGIRVAANHEAGTELRSGALTDLESGAISASLEASRRFGAHWKLVLLGQLFIANDDTDPSYWFRRDDYAEATVEYHF